MYVIPVYLYLCVYQYHYLKERYICSHIEIKYSTCMEYVECTIFVFRHSPIGIHRSFTAHKLPNSPTSYKPLIHTLASMPISTGDTDKVQNSHYLHISQIQK